MMFLINCKEDNSFCIVEEDDVLCDKATIAEDKEVLFLWNKKTFLGKIIKKSGKTLSLI